MRRSIFACSIVVTLSASAALAQAPPEALRASLAAGGTLHYELVGLANGSRSTLTLSQGKQTNEYVRSDGARFRDLGEMFNDQAFAFSPPLPMYRQPLAAGTEWQHKGIVRSRRGVGATPVQSDFSIGARTRIATPAGEFDVVEVVEDRKWTGSELNARFVITRLIDVERGLVVKETMKTVAVYKSFATFILPDDYELTLLRLPE